MSTTSDDIEIDLDDVEAPKPTDKAKTEAKADDLPLVQVEKVEKPPKKARVNPDEGLAKLQEDLAKERSLRLEADARAQKASEAEVQARTAVRGSQIDIVNNAITQYTASKAQLEASYAQALTDQDFAAAAKIQGQMVEAQVRLSQMERTKVQLEKAPKPTPTVTPDAVEALAAQLSPKSAEWVRNHPEFVRDPAKKRRMERAHEDAVDDGLTPDTAAYFEFIEGRLKLRNADAPTDVEAYSDAARPTQTRSAPPASAPVSRSGNGTASRSNVVTLTSEQVEMAKLMDMTPQEYARHTLAIKREGMN